jgi:WD40 repeat protein
LVKVLAEDFPPIGNLAFSPDGQTLAASHDKGVTIWDTDSARQLSFIALEPPPDSLEFSSDGARLAGTTWIRHDLVFINDVRSDRPTVCFAGITGDGMRYSLAPDGKTLASAGIGLPATLWDASNGQKKATFTGGVREINTLVFAPDGKSIFLGCGDGRVRAWRTAPELPPILSLDGCTDEVWSLAFAPDGESLFSGADDHLITVWNPRSGLRIGELRGHEALVASLAIERTGTTMASASFDGTVRLWDLAAGTEKLVLRGHSGAVRAVAFSLDGRQVASGGDDNVVRLWDAAGGRPLSVIPGHTAKIRAVSFDPGGKYLVSAGNDRTVRILDRDANAVRQILKGATNIASLAFSPDGAFLAAGDEGGDVTIWHTGSWENRALMRVCEAPVWGLSYSPDGETLAAACGDAKVRLLHPDTSQILLELDGHATRVNAVAVAPSGRAVASASHDGAIKVWIADAP